eukprot:7318209-Pyramimonas_sp.AAC.1
MQDRALAAYRRTIAVGGKKSAFVVLSVCLLPQAQVRTRSLATSRVACVHLFVYRRAGGGAAGAARLHAGVVEGAGGVTGVPRTRPPHRAPPPSPYLRAAAAAWRGHPSTMVRHPLLPSPYTRRPHGSSPVGPYSADTLRRYTYVTLLHTT